LDISLEAKLSHFGKEELEDLTDEEVVGLTELGDESGLFELEDETGLTELVDETGLIELEDTATIQDRS
jgi:hypothetical protein